MKWLTTWKYENKKLLLLTLRATHTQHKNVFDVIHLCYYCKLVDKWLSSVYLVASKIWADIPYRLTVYVQYKSIFSNNNEQFLFFWQHNKFLLVLHTCCTHGVVYVYDMSLLVWSNFRFERREKNGLSLLLVDGSLSTSP